MASRWDSLRFVCDGWMSRAVGAACLAAVLGSVPRAASAQNATGEITTGQVTPGQNADPSLGGDEGRLYNIASQPFTFRLLRSTGPIWTQSYTLAPNQYLSIRPLKPGQRSELLGVLGNREGYVIIQYPELGGQMSFRLPARNPQSTEYEPTWFHVEDSDNISWLVQAGSIEAATAIQANLQKQPHRSPDEISRLKRNLEANWVLSLPRDASASRGGPGWRCCQ